MCVKNMYIYINDANERIELIMKEVLTINLAVEIQDGTVKNLNVF